MAYAFNGSDQYISGTKAQTRPYTLFAKALLNETGRQQDVVTLATAASTSGAVELRFLSTNLAAIGDFAVDAANASVTGTVSQGVWYAMTGRLSSVDSRHIFSGVSSAQSIVHVSVSSPQDLTIGCLRFNNSISAYLNGYICDAAIWSAALTDAEIVSLAKGFKPTRIRPQSLVFYAPLVRNLQDVRAGLALTNNNSATVADHPRVY